MGRPAITKDTIRAQTVRAMRAMNTYREEYDPIIDLYSGLREQYERLSREYEDGKSYRYSTPTADGGEKKSPLSLTVENLRKDILAYSDRLMLNPKSRTEQGKEKKRSKLAELVELVDNGR